MIFLSHHEVCFSYPHLSYTLQNLQAYINYMRSNVLVHVKRLYFYVINDQTIIKYSKLEQDKELNVIHKI